MQNLLHFLVPFTFCSAFAFFENSKSNYMK